MFGSDQRFAPRSRVWLRSLADKIVEADVLALALGVGQLFPSSPPFPGILAVWLLSLLFRQGRERLATNWPAYGGRLPYRLFIVASAAAFWHYAWDAPFTALSFAPLWWLLSAVPAIRSPAFRNWTAACVDWIEAGWRRSQRYDGEAMLLELAVWAAAFYCVGMGVPKFWPGWWLPGLLIAAWGTGRGLSGWHRPTSDPVRDGGRMLISCFALTVVTGITVAFADRKLPTGFGPLFFWGTLASVSLPWCLRRGAARWGDVRSERLRWVAVGVVGLWLLRGFARYTLHGAGDALWYATMLADVVTQFRHGLFPVWIGQSIFQFNGAFYPLRVAPGFLYLGGLLDALTFRSLGTFALQNFELTLTGIIALFATYFSLGALLPRRRGAAALLSVLFLACPGVLGLAYNSDLYMSWTTLPCIPVAWYATVRLFEDRKAQGMLLLLGAALGLCWWGHSPIALWSTALAGLFQLVRLACQGLRGQLSRAWISAAVVFAAVAAYPVGSVLFYPPLAGGRADNFQRATAGSIAYFVDSAFPASIRPLSANGRLLGDFQLGYTLWSVLLVATVIALIRRRAAPLALLGVAWLLACLLLPVPALNLKLWEMIPDLVRDTTGNWAMNRLYVPLAAAIIFGTAGLLGAVPADRARCPTWLFVLLALGCVWSVGQAGAFVVGSRAGSRPLDTAASALRPENIQITRFAYLVFPKWPSTFTHGVAVPELENRLLQPSTFALLDSNLTAALRAGRTLASGQFTVYPPPQNFLQLDRTFRIEPGHHYLLDFDFLKPDTSGTLQVLGPSLFREYGLPEYGGDHAFGAGSPHAHAFGLSTTFGSAETLIVRMSPSSPDGVARLAAFGRARLLEYDPEALPIRVTSWLPYRADVRSPSPAWLETPRMYQEHYRGTVDGIPARLTASPDGLTCIAVPAGHSQVELRFVPPLGLLGLFWLSMAGMAGFLTWSLVRVAGPSDRKDAAGERRPAG